MLVVTSLLLSRDRATTFTSSLRSFQDDLLPCESFDEFVDVMQLHEVVGGDSAVFLKQLFESLPA